MPTDAWLRELVAALRTPAVVAFALTGSMARGEATRYSDVDLLRFTLTPPEADYERYTLLMRDEWLVSLSTATIAAKHAELTHPAAALFAVAGLRQMRILDDPLGALTQLQGEAHAFSWQQLQAEADTHVSETVLGVAEEVSKVLGALERQDESAAAYGTLGLVNGLTRAMAIHHRLLIVSENTYFVQVQAAMGSKSEWTRLFRLAAGLDVGLPDATPFETHARAGLALYRETVAQMRHLLPERHSPVVDMALTAIAQAGLALPGK
jgi:predicted nucleic acid-binding protein